MCLKQCQLLIKSPKETVETEVELFNLYNYEKFRHW
jgi:hypothetical protein